MIRAALHRLCAAIAVGSLMLALPGRAAAPSVVRGQGFAIRSTTVELPYDESFYPDGPGADVMNANCTACHSASMALTQPKLTHAQWAAIVHKMRDVYRAPVQAEDVPQIVDYLARLR